MRWLILVNEYFPGVFLGELFPYMLVFSIGLPSFNLAFGSKFTRCDESVEKLYALFIPIKFSSRVIVYYHSSRHKDLAHKRVIA